MATSRTDKQPSWRTDKRKTAERGYGGAWRKARLQYLRDHPLCVMCSENGVDTAAQVVDHIKPHKGDELLFWDRNNWQSLCKPHHDSDKKLEERGAERRTRFDAQGRVIW